MNQNGVPIEPNRPGGAMAHVGIGSRSVSSTGPRPASKDKQGILARRLARVPAGIVLLTLLADLCWSSPAWAAEPAGQDDAIAYCQSSVGPALWYWPPMGDVQPDLVQKQVELCAQIIIHPNDPQTVAMAKERFANHMQLGIGYGPNRTATAARSFDQCLSDKTYGLGDQREYAPVEIMDAITGCNNAVEVVIGTGWAEHLANSVRDVVLLDLINISDSPEGTFSHDEAVNYSNVVYNELVACFLYRLGISTEYHDPGPRYLQLERIREDCAQTVASLVMNFGVRTTIQFQRNPGSAQPGCGSGGSASDQVAASWPVAQTTDDPQDAPLVCLATPQATPTPAVAPEPPPSPPATPAPAAPAVATQSAGTLWHVKVQAASGSTSTWTSTWTLRPGSSNEFDVKQVRFDGSVTTYHLRVTIGSDNKLRAEAFGDMQGPSSCDQLVLMGTLAGNAVSDGTYTCVGYKGTWQGTVEGRG